MTYTTHRDTQVSKTILLVIVISASYYKQLFAGIKSIIIKLKQVFFRPKMPKVWVKNVFQSYI